MADQKVQLEKIITSLEKVDKDLQNMILNMSKSLSDIEIIQTFNQGCIDLFTNIAAVVKKIGMEKEIKFGGYKLLLENAMKINAKLPVDNFTLVVLEFADHIYSGDETFFMDRSYGKAKVEVGNEFTFIRSEPFKHLWKDLDSKDKEMIKEKFILVTTYAHAYFFKTVLSNR